VEKRFANKVCLVTGAASGIGKATALALGREGGKVVVADINVDLGRETVALIREAGGNAIFVKTDVSQTSEVESMVKTCVQTYGGLDCAVNNAGIDGGARFPLTECPEEIWNHVLAVNLTGVWYCLKYEIPQMLKQGGGTIVNIASVAGLRGGEQFCAYVASKHGVVGLTKTAALENVTKNIRVNAVCPAFIETPLVTEGAWKGKSHKLAQLIPMKRMGQPNEISDAILWLCSDAASFVTGNVLTIDGGTMA
jgi:NAD(P)-dependent dehydrogenase (short-subunit alcohol dehydrogenase family)